MLAVHWCRLQEFFMASQSFPQIPSTVWTGVWSMLSSAPSRKIDESVLAIELNVQRTAARQYLNELGRLGLFGDDGSATALGDRWRMDGNDRDVILEILQTAYPRELIELAPPERLDREKIVRWFKAQKLGEGAAKNKAATYVRIASGVSSDSGEKPAPTKRTPRLRAAAASTEVPSKPQSTARPAPATWAGAPSLNVNIQIHIGADATADQIDSIFGSMAKHFGDAQVS
jgi:hypothetical protein